MCLPLFDYCKLADGFSYTKREAHPYDVLPFLALADEICVTNINFNTHLSTHPTILYILPDSQFSL